MSLQHLDWTASPEIESPHILQETQEPQSLMSRLQSASNDVARYPFSMQTPSPFPQLIPNRIRALLPRVRNLIWENRRPIPAEVTEATVETLDLETARSRPRRPLSGTEFWGRLFDQRWARVDLSTAEPGDYLQWQDQGEATLYVGEMPHYGLDPEHTHAPLPEGIREAWLECYCSRTHYVHGDMLTPAGCRSEGAWLVRRNEEAWHAYHDLQCLADLAFFLHENRSQGSGANQDTAYHYPALDFVPPHYRQLLRHLEQAADAFDLGGLEMMQPRLTSAFTDLHDASPRIRACFMGHAHLDLVYLWPETIGEAKAVHTFSSVNRLMERYPEFRFTYSQPASYEAVARRSPALMEAVRHRIAEGRWQPTGALRVESDLLMACGEGLARSFSLGQAGFLQLCGALSKVLWLPDCFGFPSCIPTLARLAGVESFFTAKLSWNAINRFPYSSFLWRGADGSDLVAHVARAGGYSDTANIAKMHAGANAHVQADIHREFVHAVGFGDGGGGPTEALLERARRFRELAGVPSVIWDQPEEFFERLAPLRPQLPVWQGELYLEYHRGTTTTHARVKAAFRAMERALQVREAVAVSLGETPDLDEPWKRLVMHQFHDDIPGTAVPEVYRDTLADLETQAKACWEQTREALTDPAGETCVFNPHGVEWKGWVEADGAPHFVELPPLAGVKLSPPPQPPAAATAEGLKLSNDRVEALLGEDGSLVSLKIEGRPLELLPGACLPYTFPDQPANYDAWDIDRHSLSLRQSPSAPAEITISEAGGWRASITVRRLVGTQSEFVLHYRLEAGSSLLLLEAELEWREPQTLLKMSIPTAYRGRSARFGAPFGSTLRGQQPGALEGEAQWEAAGSRWVAVAHDGETDGLALLTEAKYGFSARDGELTVSLVRSPLQTGYQAHGHMTPRFLSRHQERSVFSDQGQHRIRLALARHDLRAPRELQAAALVETLFTSPVVYRGGEISSPFAGLRGGETLIPTWVVPVREDRWVLRLHEVCGQAGEVILPEGLRAEVVDLLLRPIHADRLVGMSYRYRPYEIVSLLVRR